uniref:Metalloendopeptidase n=1 Tax=Parastrongyloides trichosuri TaxID=131310 RepID=A0A0N4ZM69_PARTI
MKPIHIIFLLIVNSLYTYEGILNDTNCQWEFPIKFYVGYALDGDAIRKAFQTIMHYTCLKFEETIYFYNETQHGLRFYKGNHSYSDSIGRKKNLSLNFIYLNDKYKSNQAMIQSLIFLALGIFPEQTRSDRDKYVHIYWGNISHGANMIYFNKTNTTYAPEYDTHYDFGSTVHFTGISFSNTYNETISAYGWYHETYQEMMGQKIVVSFNNYKLLNRHYCKNKCNNTLGCWRNGYENPKKCDECICPYPFTGRICNGIKPSGYYCPFTHRVVGNRYQYDTFQWYYYCYAYIEASEKHLKVELTILEIIDVDFKSPCARSKNMIEVKYKKEKDVMGLCFCSNRNLPYKIVSEDNLMVILYRSDKYYQRIKIKYRSVYHNNLDKVNHSYGQINISE